MNRGDSDVQVLSPTTYGHTEGEDSGNRDDGSIGHFNGFVEKSQPSSKILLILPIEVGLGGTRIDQSTNGSVSQSQGKKITGIRGREGQIINGFRSRINRGGKGP